MISRGVLVMATLLGCIPLLHLSSNAANADDVKTLGRRAVLLVLEKDAAFHITNHRGLVRSAETLRRGTAVVGVRRGTLRIGSEQRECWRVHTAGGTPLSGWVAVEAVQPLNALAAAAKARGLALSKTPDEKAKSLPELIRLQENPLLRDAWRDIEAAIKENDALPPQERLPEPYFARAEIWACVNHYSEALRDYLTAIKYARLSGRDLMSYSAYFDKLYEVTDRFQKVPATPTLGKNDGYAWAARNHYAQGCHALWQNKFETALQRFDNAVQLQPNDPLYWYFRALTFKKMGDAERAQCDALFGAYLERNGPHTRSRELGHAFTRVQGRLRQWLESYRLGDPSHRLLQSAVEGIPVIEPTP